MGKIYKKNVISKIKEYLPFTWEKANNCRGLSAMRSMQHFRNWFYMFSKKETNNITEKMQDYEYYGKPWLVVISELMDFNWKEYDDGQRVNNEDDIPLSNDEIQQEIYSLCFIWNANKSTEKILQ